MANDVGYKIRVIADYTDAGANVENVTFTTTNTVVAVDLVAPTLASVTPIPTPHIDTTPSFVFSSDEAGTITSNYGFSSTTSAIASNNTITFNALSVGTYNDVWVKVTDAAGNVSTQLNVPQFQIVSPSTNGSVAISGTETVGQVLTATVTDANSVSGTITYQWSRGGSAISGATSNTYTLVSADAGQTLTVNAQYTDDVGNAENVTSTATGAIVSTTNGSVAISGTEIIGQTLTATVTDANNVSGAITYQWSRGGSAISGATSNTYTLVFADAGQTLTVNAQYTDDASNAENVTSSATGVISAPTTMAVSSFSTSSYRFDAYGTTDNPTLTLKKGSTYTFNLTSISGHPFYIKTASSTGTNNQYTSGVTGNGNDKDSLTFAVPSDAPATLYYNCQHHSAMAGTINII